MTQALVEAASGAVSRARRVAGRRSPLTFMRTYLPAHASLPPCRMHEEMNGLLVEASRTRGARLAIAAPRGHAKSTLVSTALVLWSICYGLEHHVVLISNTGQQAMDFLGIVKTELTSNPMILADFPNAAEPRGLKPRPWRWRRDEIVTRNGIRVTALGTGQRIRGRKHGQHRPTLIVLDDIENETDVRSPEMREQKLLWFQRAVANAGSSATNIVVVGTILHFDALLYRLLDPRLTPGWTTRTYRAVEAWSAHPELWEQWEAVYAHRAEHEGKGGPEAALAFFKGNEQAMLEGTNVLWPQRENYYQLMEMRVREGRYAFDSEKQNQPVNPGEALFRDEEIVFWDSRGEDAAKLLSRLPKKSILVCACDPSLGKAGGNRDDTAIVSVARDAETGLLYVIDADIARRRPDDIIDTLIKYQQIRNFEKVIIEINQFQEFLADEVRRRSRERDVPLHVAPVQHSTDKLGRIQSLQPLVSSGTLRFSKRHTVLLDQLRQFPHAAHDDGPDALEMAVDIAQRFGAIRAMPVGQVIVGTGWR